MQRGELNETVRPLPRALFLVLFGLILAVLWVVFGSTHSASADEAPSPTPASPAAAPSLLGSVASTVDGVVAAVAPRQPAIVTPVVQAVSTSVTAIVRPTAAPVTAVVAPITHTVDAVVAAVPGVVQVTGSTPVSTVTTPLTSTLDAVTGPILRPVLTDVVGPVLTDVVGPVLGPVIGPVVIPELEGGGTSVGGLLDLEGNVLVTAGSASSATGAAALTRSDIRVTRAVAGNSTSPLGSSALVPAAPASPFSPFGGAPADGGVGMLAGSSSVAGAVSGAAAAGVLGGFALPAHMILLSAASAADDSLPSSLALDPGSSPD